MHLIADQPKDWYESRFRFISMKLIIFLLVEFFGEMYSEYFYSLFTDNPFINKPIPPQGPEYCAAGQFHCGNKVCIPYIYYCDGVPNDCEGNVDSFSCSKYWQHLN